MVSHKDRIFLEGWRPYVWIFFAGFILYFHALFFGLTNFDDTTIVVQNYHFLKSMSHLGQIFGEDVFHRSEVGGYFYRPIVTFSFMFDTQIAGKTQLFYHLTNILVHLLASGLIFFLLTRLRYREEISFLISIIFVVHPIHTQAVAWLPGRNDSLLTVFILFSFLSMLNFLDQRRKLYLLLHFLFFALSLFTKETAIVFPFLILLYLHWVGPRKISFRLEAGVLSGWSIIIAFWFLLRHFALETPLRIPLSKLLMSFIPLSQASIQFLGKFLLPVQLSVLPNIESTSFVPGFIAIITILTGFILTKKKRIKFILFGALWFILFLWPSFSSYLLLATPTCLEPRAYLPMIGMMFILLEMDPIRRLNLKEGKGWLFSFVIIIVLSAITFHHAGHFKDPISFWEDAVRTSPNSSLAHYGLGATYAGKTKSEMAEDEYWKALAINPHYPDAYENLGILYYKAGRLNEAEVSWKRSISISEGHLVGHYGLGLIYLSRNMLMEAEEEMKKALTINPFYDSAQFHLGLVYARQGRIEEAKELWEKTLQNNPENKEAQINLAIYYYNQKDFPKARTYFAQLQKERIAIDPRILGQLDIK